MASDKSDAHKQDGKTLCSCRYFCQSTS